MAMHLRRMMDLPRILLFEPNSLSVHPTFSKRQTSDEIDTKTFDFVNIFEYNRLKNYSTERMLCLKQ
jgi:hypothetical protein